jgi:outer membrane protein TolC
MIYPTTEGRMAHKSLLAAAALLIGSALAGCNLESPPVFDPRQMQQLERQRSADAEPNELEALPTTRVDPSGAAAGSDQNTVISAPTTGPDLDALPTVRMSLREIIQRGVASNHDVRVAGYQPAIEGARVIENEGNFDPTFFTNISYQHKNELNGGNIYNTFNGLGLITTNQIESDIAQVQTGIQQNLDSGGQIQLQYENSYN